ncbi:transposase [Acinetobacter sp. ANC 4216]|uniref:putative metallopeptidase n=1 Tax=Acinetobacter sp. ANC 4216 TaxID=2529840 RepID=UPI00103976C6|nr:putative metallopeptidase [Acinetobacter sp. ANC 4216]TCB71587.1 transposase [Acinetobacter sp. ANC 4216]
MNRPYPPKHITDPEEWTEEFLFEPAQEIYDWLHTNILDPNSKLYNPDHEHLVGHSGVCFLWAEKAFNKLERIVLGQAEIVQFQVSGWKKFRQEAQLIRWFGFLPKALITLDAHYCSYCSDEDFMALVEHELYHLMHKISPNGGPCYDSHTGHPILKMRGHDVEEFFGVVRRYGGHSDIQKMAKLVEDGPTISRANIAHACGTCLLKLA